MNAVQSFSASVARFRAWAVALDVAIEDRSGEWECDYDGWSEIYRAWAALLVNHPLHKWSDALVADVLYALARDNECQVIAHELAKHANASLLTLTELAFTNGEPDAKWQLAVELGKLMNYGSRVEAALVRMADDADEYVRRRALQSLATIAPQLVVPLALREWANAPDAMPWTRMNVLAVLAEVGAPELPALRRIAMAAPNAYLREFAATMRTAELDAAQ